MESVEPIEHSGSPKDDTARCKIVLALDFDTIVSKKFKKEFISEIAKKLDIPESHFKIESLKAGSIEVVLLITGALLALSTSGWFTYRFHDYFEQLNTRLFLFYMGMWGAGVGAMLGGGVGFVGGPMGSRHWCKCWWPRGWCCRCYWRFYDSRPRTRHKEKLGSPDSSEHSSETQMGDISFFAGKSTQVEIRSMILDGLVDLYPDDDESDGFLGPGPVGASPKKITPVSNFGDFGSMPTDDFMSELFSDSSNFESKVYGD
eukprot:TRINITY_DN2422_c0_g1_i1.p1 TRINITY_DN2422_c0_g1~~TRINITY_DN2422_c0_g1_i1.p1  ORF type:complete len:260 (+),score=44.85 TRINITY_DN2422_c0_g1_i1:854-1633(+)